MDKNLLKAIALSFLVLLIWDKMGFFGKPVKKQVAVQKKEEVAAPLQAPNDSKPPEAQAQTPSLSLPENTSLNQAPSAVFEEKTLQIKSLQSEIEFSNKGGRINSVFLKKYNETLFFQNSQAPLLSILRVGSLSGIQFLPFEISKPEESGTVNSRCKVNSEVELSTCLSASATDYLYTYKVIIKNNGTKELFFPDGVELGSGTLPYQTKTTYPTLGFARYTVENKTEYVDYGKVNGRQSIDETFQWGGIQNTTYCSILSEPGGLRKANWLHIKDEKSVSASFSTDDFSLPAGQEKVFTFNFYLGPKLYFHMKKFNLNFEQIIDYGSILGPITKPLVLFLNFLYNLTGNYGIAIILMTIVFRIATYPLTLKSIVSMKAMQKIQPQLKQLQAQYKNNQAMLQKEMVALYKKHKVNPLSGCLPMLIQLPIFIAFFKAIANSVELHGASFLFIRDLAAPDKMIPLGNFSLNVLPVLMGGVQFISSKQTTTDPTQKHLIYIFPVMMVVIFYSMPSALNLYFLVSTLFGIAQTWWINRPSKVEVEQVA